MLRTVLATSLIALVGCSGSNHSGDLDASTSTDANALDAQVCEAFSDPAETFGTDCPSGSPGAVGADPLTVTLGDVTVYSNLTYASRGGRILQGDVFVPPVPSGTPGALVMIHGGGWQDCLRRRDAVGPIALAYASLLSVPVFNIEYRLAPEGGTYPGAVTDVLCAMQWFATQSSTYGFDPERIAVIGESAGAHLALMTAMTNHRGDLDPQCGDPVTPLMAVSVSAPTDLPELVANPGVLDASAAATGFTDSECTSPATSCQQGRGCDPCIDASPIAQACHTESEIVLVQAPDPWDALIPEAQATRMQQALENAGKTVTLIKPAPAAFENEAECTQGAAHGFVPCLNNVTGADVIGTLAPKLAPF